MKVWVCPKCGHRSVELRPSEKKVLDMLANGQSRWSEIKRETGISSPSLSEALTALIDEKFVRRKESYYELIRRELKNA